MKTDNPVEETTTSRCVAANIADFFTALKEAGVPDEAAAKCAVIYMEAIWGRK